ncbi:MAG TPA: DUF2244 domain-containing protein [Geminicoccaceae bacterium]|nr:DUF2244 domain-containing protein [Geminicoccus sp.]HMU52666.1 DUF2244 domain-containing protein [Geminicoccaceae bacterium]
MDETDSRRVPFEAVLYPNPPLGDAGLFALMLAVALVSAGLGAAFVLAGAWPVAGFMGLDVLLLALAFRACRRRSRHRELIRLDDSGLHVRKTRPDGRSAEWRFDPYWVRVGLDEPPRPQSPLTLSASGRTLRIGQFLTAEERRGLAQALRSALAPYR